ncbi:MAG: hypothetical protein CVV33_03635, partial [Methanomicrobiales archaeon HGW-Methanomicrobiales-4]
MNPKKKFSGRGDRSSSPHSLKKNEPKSREQANSPSPQRISSKDRDRNASPATPGMPPLLEDLILAYIREKIGKEPGDTSFLSRLRQAVMAQKAMYWKDNPGKKIKYGRGYDIFAYLAYHFPVYFTQFRSLLQGLANDNVLPDEATLLDIGTGPGVVPLAMIDLWRSQGKGKLDIFSIERSEEHVEAYRYLVPGYVGTDSSITVHPVIQGDLIKPSTIEHQDLPEKTTIISFQNVLAELEHISIPKRAEIVLSYTKNLVENGFLIIVEPAELRHATSLRLLQRELIKSGLHVYAPCSYLWGSGCDPSSCWTFREEHLIETTTLMEMLAGDEEGYRFINTDLKYAYLILTKSTLTRCKYRIPMKNRLTRLSHLERHAGRVISIAGARMSEDIGTKGMHIFKVCDGTCREPVYAVLSSRNRRPGHSPLFNSAYGDPLIFSGVQIRRHPKHKAWNLIISADTRIERAL